MKSAIPIVDWLRAAEIGARTLAELLAFNHKNNPHAADAVLEQLELRRRETLTAADVVNFDGFIGKLRRAYRSEGILCDAEGPSGHGCIRAALHRGNHRAIAATLQPVEYKNIRDPLAFSAEGGAA